eukprot:1140400-Pelagomonas_calceolata.AAC.7
MSWPAQALQTTCIFAREDHEVDWNTLKPKFHAYFADTKSNVVMFPYMPCLPACCCSCNTKVSILPVTENMPDQLQREP